MVKIFSYDGILKSPVTLTYLSKFHMEKDKLDQYLHLRNHEIAMDGWVVIKEKKPQVNS